MVLKKGKATKKFPMIVQRGKPKAVQRSSSVEGNKNFSIRHMGGEAAGPVRGARNPESVSSENTLAVSEDKDLVGSVS